MTLYFITGNKNKLIEAQAILPGIEQLDLDLPELQEIDARRIIEAKLQEAMRRHPTDGADEAFIVEDTSLHLECLGGLPGPLIKWFLKTIGPEGIARLAQLHRNDRASAVCMVGYARRGRIEFFKGEVPGRIVAPRGERKFGWDPIFVPEGHDKTFAEMTDEEKNLISHRRMALNKLKAFYESR